MRVISCWVGARPYMTRLVARGISRHPRGIDGFTQNAISSNCPLIVSRWLTVQAARGRVPNVAEDSMMTTQKPDVEARRSLAKPRYDWRHSSWLSNQINYNPVSSPTRANVTSLWLITALRLITICYDRPKPMLSSLNDVCKILLSVLESCTVEWSPISDIMFRQERTSAEEVVLCVAWVATMSAFKFFNISSRGFKAVYYSTSILLFSTNVIIHHRSYDTTPMLLYNINVINQHQCYYTLSMLSFRTNVFIHHRRYYTTPMLLISTNVINQHQYYYTSPTLLYNTDVINQHQCY